jgi:long-chain acyl-CoA synthetase
VDRYASHHASPAASLRARARSHPERVALLTHQRSLTYGELDVRVDRTASTLRAAGVGEGDRVGYLARNRPEYLELLYAVSRIGAVIVPVNWRLAPREVAGVLLDAAPRLTFVSDDERELLRELDGPLATVDLDRGGFERWLDAVPGQPDTASGVQEEHAADPDAPMWQLYTSGTTGAPKGVVLANRNLMGMIEGLCDAWRFGSDRVVYVPYPVFHAVGTAWPVLTLHRGGRVILRDGFDPDDLLTTTEREQVTNTMMVPAVLQMVLDAATEQGRDLSSLRTIVYGAAPITESLRDRAIAALPHTEFVHAYGLTEATGTVTNLPWDEHDPTGPRRHSCGRPFGWVEIRVVDPDTLSELPSGEVGEVLVRSRSVMAGYHGHPEQTTQAITADGWLRTGDAGWVDAKGYLTLTDRIDDMIITGGENVYPAEVENVLHAHPLVREVAVIGVPDERWGEAVRAVVVPRGGATAPEEELIAWCQERLAHYKCPRSVELRSDPLPLNATGKVMRRRLRDAYWRHEERRI